MERIVDRTERRENGRSHEKRQSSIAIAVWGWTGFKHGFPADGNPHFSLWHRYGWSCSLVIRSGKRHYRAFASLRMEFKWVKMELRHVQSKLQLFSSFIRDLDETNMNIGCNVVALS